MNNTNFVPFVCVVSLLSMLAGCGGGGSASTSSSGPVPPASRPSLPPTTTPTQVASLQEAVPASYPAGSYKSRLFTTVNSFRTSQGLGPLIHDLAIDRAAANHQAYVTLHESGGDAHNEEIGKAGYTGASPLQRLHSAGYDGSAAGEVIGFAPNWPILRYDAADALIATVYHRAVLMVQGYTHVGIAEANNGGPVYINIGMKQPQKNSGDYVGIYPVNGQKDFPLNHALESPNPFYEEMEMTHANMCLRTSAPISVASEASSVLNVSEFSVTEVGQTTPLPAWLITYQSNVQNRTYMTPNLAFLVAKKPFKPNATYTVRFTGKASGQTVGGEGKNISMTWSFSTGIGDIVNCSALN